MYTLLLLLGCLSARLTCGYAATGAWPMPGSLVGLWPFDSESGLKDVANDLDLSGSGSQKLVANLNGPFNQTSSSYSVSCEYCYVGSRDGIALTSELTVSFYFYTEAKGNGAILEFWRGPKFAISYLEPNIVEIWGGPETDNLIARYPILTPKSWNFVAITYSKTTGDMKVYDQTGNEVGLTTKVDVQTGGESTKLFVGQTRWVSAWVYMKPTDAIACLVLYNTTLSASQIGELPYHCQTKGRGTTKAQPTTTPNSTPKPKPSVWPKPDALLGFWPLNTQYRFGDASQNAFNGAQQGPVEYVPGPFGDDGTAMKPETDGAKVLTVTKPELALNKSFSLSLFFAKAADSKEQGGIFEFLDRYNTPNSFQFRYENETTIEVSALGYTVGHYQMVLQKGAWTFIAFVFDHVTGMFTVYGRHGVIAPASYQPQMMASHAFNNNGVRLGYTTKWNEGLKAGDALSCLMVYSAALTASEVKEAFEACRAIHGSAPCGTPKLALSPIPTSTSITTIPKAGQFPYIASLRYSGMPVCSASIVDQFWLLTSRSCFPESTNATLHKIYVGEHDFNVTNKPQTKIHAVSKIIVAGNANRDVVLVQVTDPIDLTNQYVNDACFYDPENIGELSFDTIQFVMGWGRNGRQPLLSKSLPRYVPGLMLADDQCIESWNDGDYVSGKDFCFMSSSNDKNVPCHGDEGTPLLVQSPGDPTTGRSDRLVELGIYYKRDNECTQVMPGLFTNIGNYKKWITETIACAIPEAYYPKKCPQS